MELPTYTSIWRIEKRLYKLYDFRLPMPLPVGQIAVFTAITVPYVILLTLFGLPFSHTLFWLYVLPPGVLTWLATRPVLESKRLPELIISQVRYIGEPSAWCRMTPHVERDDMIVTGRVWRRSQPQPAVETPAVPSRPAVPAVEPAAVPVVARPGERADRRPVPANLPGQASGRVRVPAAAGPGPATGAARGAGKPRGVRATGAARGDANGHGGANGNGSVPAAFGASGRSTPPAPAPAKAPAPAVPPGAAGASAPAVPASASPAAPVSAPAPASAPASASAPALTIGPASASPGAPVSAPRRQAPRHPPAVRPPPLVLLPPARPRRPAPRLLLVLRLLPVPGLRPRPLVRHPPARPRRPAPRLLLVPRPPPVLLPPMLRPALRQPLVPRRQPRLLLPPVLPPPRHRLPRPRRRPSGTPRRPDPCGRPGRRWWSCPCSGAPSSRPRCGPGRSSGR